jgi:hypothetical protein
MFVLVIAVASLDQTDEVVKYDCYVSTLGVGRACLYLPGAPSAGSNTARSSPREEPVLAAFVLTPTAPLDDFHQPRPSRFTPSATLLEVVQTNSVVECRRRGWSRRRSGSRRAPGARPAADCWFPRIRAMSSSRIRWPPLCGSGSERRSCGGGIAAGLVGREPSSGPGCVSEHLGDQRGRPPGAVSLNGAVADLAVEL